MFSKQHYEAIANILKPYHEYNFTRNFRDSEAVNKMIDNLVGDFGDYLEKENPRFDRVKFLRAIGYGS